MDSFYKAKKLKDQFYVLFRERKRYYWYYWW